MLADLCARYIYEALGGCSRRMSLPIRRFEIHIDTVQLSREVLADGETQGGARVLLQFTDGRVVNYATDGAQASVQTAQRPFANFGGAELAFMVHDGRMRIISPAIDLVIVHARAGARPRALPHLRWCYLEWGQTYMLLRGSGQQYFMVLRVERCRIPLAALNM